METEIREDKELLEELNKSVEKAAKDVERWSKNLETIEATKPSFEI